MHPASTRSKLASSVNTTLVALVALTAVISTVASDAKNWYEHRSLTPVKYGVSVKDDARSLQVATPYG
ncbi:hypothetical protein GNE10_13310 [Nostoc sp. 2RC]|nr:hypothetical protein [Nostoc sp. 2RC]